MPEAGRTNQRGAARRRHRRRLRPWSGLSASQGSHADRCDRNQQQGRDRRAGRSAWKGIVMSANPTVSPEPTIYELSQAGRIGVNLPKLDVPQAEALPSDLLRDEL